MWNCTEIIPEVLKIPKLLLETFFIVLTCAMDGVGCILLLRGAQCCSTTLLEFNATGSTSTSELHLVVQVL